MSFGPYGTLFESQGTVTLRLTRRPRIRLFQLAWILEIPHMSNGEYLRLRHEQNKECRET